MRGISFSFSKYQLYDVGVLRRISLPSGSRPLEQSRRLATSAVQSREATVLIHRTMAGRAAIIRLPIDGPTRNADMVVAPLSPSCSGSIP